MCLSVNSAAKNVFVGKKKAWKGEEGGGRVGGAIVSLAAHLFGSFESNFTPFEFIRFE